MKKNYFLVMLLMYSLIGFSQATNYTCATAENINVTTVNTAINFDIASADTETTVVCGSNSGVFANIWYKFTMPVNGNLFINGTLNWNRFEVYEGSDCGTATQIECFSGALLIPDLTMGTEYKIRLARAESLASNSSYLSFGIQAFEQAENDTCDSSTNITVSSTQSTVNFEIAGADIENEIGCDGATAYEYTDIWYDFTMPFNGSVFIGGAIAWNQFAVYSGDCNTLIEENCFAGNQLTTDLIAGTNYKIRLFRQKNLADNTGYFSFTIQAFEKAMNDTCDSSSNITVSTTDATVNFEIAGADIISEVGCDGGSNQDLADIWYDFTMPVDGSIFINGAIAWNQFAIYSNDCGSLVQENCFSGSDLTPNLTANTDYKLRVFRSESLANNSAYLSFSIKAFEEVDNDTCDSSTNITVTTTAASVNFDIAGADINNEVGCNGTAEEDYADIWYDFIMPVNGNLSINGIIGWNQFAIYSGDCSTLIQEDCFSGSKLVEDLTATTEYKLRVFRDRSLADNENYLSFNIQAFEIIDNDTCDSSSEITISTTQSTINFGIAGADINNEEVCSGDTPADYADVWYNFTMPEDGYIFINGTLSWNNFAIYDTCGATEIACFTNNSYVYNLTKNTNYKLRVYRTSALAANEQYKSFTIQAFETPVNDDCSDPPMLTLGVEQTINNTNATTSLEVPTCNDFDRQDMWYKVNPGNFNALNIAVNPDGVFQLWEGTCGNLTPVSNSCYAIEGESISVSENTEYYLQIWKNDIAVGRTTGELTVLVTSAVLSSDNQTIDGFSIYPNPVKDILNINTNEVLKQIDVYNTIGQLVLRTNNLNNNIDISNLKSGIYILQVKTEDKKGIYKFIKE